MSRKASLMTQRLASQPTSAQISFIQEQEGPADMEILEGAGVLPNPRGNDTAPVPTGATGNTGADDGAKSALSQLRLGTGVDKLSAANWPVRAPKKEETKLLPPR